MYPSTSTSNYDNLVFTTSGGAACPWFVLGGAHHSRVQNGTMNISNEFRMTYSEAGFYLAEPNRESGYRYASGTLNIGGNAYVENGARLVGAQSIGGQDSSADATLTIKGNLYLKNGGILSAGSSSNFNNTYNVNFNINQLFIGNKSSFSTGSASNGRFNFNGQFNNVTVQNGGTFNAHNGGSAIFSTIAINNNLNFEKGSTFINAKGLIVGKSRENYVAVGNSVTFDNASVTQNMTLIQEKGTINLLGGGYVFANFNQTGGIFNNQGNVTFNGASINSGQFNNTGTVSFKGNSSVNQVIQGNGTVNIIGGTFRTDHFADGSIFIKGGSTTLNRLDSGAQHNLSGGELHTSISEIFENTGSMGQQALNYITGTSTEVPQTVKTLLSDFFKKYIPGFVKENLDQYASFNGGKIVLSNANLTTTQRDDLTTAFKETFFIRFPKAFPQLSAPWLWA